MSTGQFTLFDLASREPNKTWSLNPWKARMVLNFKGLDYKTEWLEYPEIRPTLEGKVTPNESGKPYTIPAAKFPDGTYIMDSRNIANAIESLHPLPSLHLTSPYQSQIDALIPRIMTSFYPIILPQVPRRLLNPSGEAYWMQDRAERVGMPIDQYEREQGGERNMDKIFGEIEPVVREVTALLGENPDGPFFLGEGKPSFADFVWVGFLAFARRIGQEHYDELLKRSGDAGVHARLFEAVGPWMERDDH